MATVVQMWQIRIATFTQRHVIVYTATGPIATIRFDIPNESHAAIMFGRGFIHTMEIIVA